MGGEGSDVESHAVVGAIDGALRLGMAALLVLAPLAFGSVESWSKAATVTAAALLGLLWIAKESFFPALCHAERERHSCLNGRTAGLFPFFAAIAGLAAVMRGPR